MLELREDEQTEEQRQGPQAAYVALRDECSVLLRCLVTGNHCTAVDEGKLETGAVIVSLSYLKSLCSVLWLAISAHA